MLKKGVKAEAAAAKAAKAAGDTSVKPKKRNELNLAMKQALDTAKLGLAFMDDMFRYNAKPLGLPQPVAYKFVSINSTAAKKKGATKKRKTMVDENESAFSDLEIDDLQQGLPMKIEQLDIALAASSKKTSGALTSNKVVDTNAIALEAELDLSNLDDLFDGDTMLGDDLLPTTF